MLRLIIILIISYGFSGCVNTNSGKEDRLMLGSFNGLDVYVVPEKYSANYYSKIDVFWGQNLIFSDTVISMYDFKNVKSRLIPITDDHFYVTLVKQDPIESDRLLILSLKNGLLIENSEIISWYLEDLDGDGFIEVGGAKMIEAPCISCDSMYYNPTNIYKLKERIEFDQINSERLTKEVFGVYLGRKVRFDTILRIRE